MFRHYLKAPLSGKSLWFCFIYTGILTTKGRSFLRYLQALPVGRSLWLCYIYRSNQSVILPQDQYLIRISVQTQNILIKKINFIALGLQMRFTFPALSTHKWMLDFRYLTNMVNLLGSKFLCGFLHPTPKFFAHKLPI